MIYAVATNIKSLRLIATELETSEITDKLSLPVIPFSTFRDGFDRFPVSLFRMLFIYLITTGGFIAIPELTTLGTIF